MRIICGPENFILPHEKALKVILYGQPRSENQGSAGENIKREIIRRSLEPAPLAWDLLSISLSVISADLAGLRKCSSDGWARVFELDIAVGDPDFWNTQADALSKMLCFLTTDIWILRFHAGGILPPPQHKLLRPIEDCIV